jgi:hypothetical protein
MMKFPEPIALPGIGGKKGPDHVNGIFKFPGPEWSALALLTNRIHSRDRGKCPFHLERPKIPSYNGTCCVSRRESASIVDALSHPPAI